MNWTVARLFYRRKSRYFAGDTEDDITARVQTQEHAIYPLVISWFADGRLKMHENAAWLDGQRLPPQGYAADE
ncbi:phosphoribosylglycinamide formyltransferase 1 [Escherichia coli]|uniref:Phosphoribosylglycinamide formyltransferase 1 n=1 Tax=Escherichia coli TaxID=562 RepID=A0A2X3JS22_ECOLX|nr:phosphoribosylglycinamide formyltransferase 1 [Escherichia coli]